jgi:hypothetical protein
MAGTDQRESDLVSQLCRRLESMKTARREHESKWSDICRFIAPRKEDVKRYTGTPDDSEIWDSVPEQALRTLASRMGGLLTNPSEKWAGLALRDIDLDEMQVAREYLDECRDRLMAVFNSDADGFQQAADEMYQDVSSLASAVMYVARDGKDIANEGRPADYSAGAPGWAGRGKKRANGERSTRFPAPNEYSRFIFKVVPIWEMYIGEDKNGRPAHMYRVFTMTYQQAWDTWGEKCSENVVQGYKNDPEQKVNICHAVYPREAIQTDRRSAKRGDALNMPFASVYFEADSKKLLEEGGHYECPYIFWRWSVVSGKVYGTGPAHIALPFVRLLHAMTETEKLAAEKLADPPLMVPDDAFIGPIRSGAGGLSYYRPSNDNNKAEALPIHADLSHLGQLIVRLEQHIEKIFLGPYIMFNEVPNETATAAQARIAEKKSLLGPVLGRAQAEFLSVLILRVFNIMFRAGDLPPVPQELAQRLAESGPHSKRMRIEYFNEMSIEQRSVSVYAFQRSMGVLAPIVGQNDPFAVLDNYDTDAIARDVPLTLGVPAKYLATEQARDEKRQQRTAAAQQQKDAQDVAAATGMAKTLSDTDLGGNNALTVLADRVAPGGAYGA